MHELLELFRNPLRFHAAIAAFADRPSDDSLDLLESALGFAVSDEGEWAPLAPTGAKAEERAS